MEKIDLSKLSKMDKLYGLLSIIAFVLSLFVLIFSLCIYSFALVLIYLILMLGYAGALLYFEIKKGLEAKKA